MQEIQKTQIRALDLQDPLEEGLATHSSICARNHSMDRGAWWAAVDRVTKIWIWMKQRSAYVVMHRSFTQWDIIYHYLFNIQMVPNLTTLMKSHQDDACALLKKLMPLEHFLTFCHTKILQVFLFAVQLLSCDWFTATPWIVACQDSLSFTVSQNMLELMPIESAMSSKHLNLCCPHILLSQSFSAPGSFPMTQHFASGGQRIGAVALASVLPMNTQGWFLLELTGFISLLFQGLSKVVLQHIVQKHQFFGAQPSLWSSSHIHT